MPPRKSTASNPPEEGAETTPAPKPTKEKDGVGIEDLTLPKSMIGRLAKGVLPANTQIQKDALLALHKSATVFVSYIAANSNDLAQMGGKKTIAPHDVMSALKDAELEHFLPRLEAELKKYNDIQCDKRNSYRHRVKQEKAAAAAGTEGRGEGEDNTEVSVLPGEQTNGTANGHAENGGGERPMKKMKGTDGMVIVPPGEAVYDDDLDEDQEADQGDDQDDDGDDDEPEDDDGQEGGEDETMEDAEDDDDGVGGVRDEALDDDGNESD